MEPLHKQRNPDLIMDPNILLSASISYDKMGKYERYTRMITSLIPLTKSLAQQKRDRHTKSLDQNPSRPKPLLAADFPMLRELGFCDFASIPEGVSEFLLSCLFGWT
ncbi:hypothetical protein V6N11_049851 [Hibiscus sabdariffa]|uniref:Uncharacterized protein n=1 Tax=Hibiscus sabdariffa TaxID=183260 RepID=A0ABR2T8N7_9ROSI